MSKGRHLPPRVRKLVTNPDDWTAELAKSGHVRLRHHPTGHVVFTGHTPSDPRATLNLRASIRRVERGQNP